MTRYKGDTVKLPDTHAIVALSNRYYVFQVTFAGDTPILKPCTFPGTDNIVSYAKRSFAVNFVLRTLVHNTLT